MSLSPIEGVYTAIVTPFDSNGEIKWDDYEKLLDHQKQGGIDGVVVCGTTGESPTVTVQEKLALVRKARAFLPPSVKVMAGSGDNNTQHSVELSKLAVDAGADSLLVVTPPYNKPSLAGLKLHFQSIADSVDKPICLYHVPSRTGQLLTPAEIGELCSIEKVTAVKEASSNLALFSRTTSLANANLLSGDDPTYLGSLAYGGKGVVSVVSNIFPEAMKSLHQSFFAGNMTRARKIHDILLPLIDILFCEPNPGPLKAILKDMGLCENEFRAPLVPVSQDNRKRILDCYQTTRTSLADLGDS